MSQPAALPADDDPIGPATPIYRLVPVEQCEPLDGAWMFGSGAFDNSSEEGFENEMSVVLGDTLVLLDRDRLTCRSVHMPISLSAGVSLSWRRDASQTSTNRPSTARRRSTSAPTATSAATKTVSVGGA